MDWATARRLGANQLKALALSTMLTTASIAAAAQQTAASATSSTSIRGVVRDGDNPLSQVEVRAKPQGAGAVTVTRTDERGAYAFDSLMPGSYVISFDAGPVTHGRGLESWDVDVEVCKGVTLVLDSKLPPQWMGEVIVVVPEKGTLAGQVTSQKHEDGVSGATVTLLRPSDGLQRTARTDAAGRYGFNGLGPGHYQLTATAPGYVTRNKGLDLSPKPLRQVLTPGSQPGDAGDIALCPLSHD